MMGRRSYSKGAYRRLGDARVHPLVDSSIGMSTPRMKDKALRSVVRKENAHQEYLKAVENLKRLGIIKDEDA